MTLVVLTALADELNHARAPQGVEVVYTGVGKLNAAVAAMRAIQTHKPALIVNYGTAGKVGDGVHGLIEIADVVQRDMIAEPLAPRGRTPFAPHLDRLSSGYGNAICGTGDSFVTSVDPWLVANGVHVVDMELFAIAHVCTHHEVPWRAFKYITDEANEHAANHWTANVASGEDLFWEELRKLRGAV